MQLQKLHWRRGSFEFNIEGDRKRLDYKPQFYSPFQPHLCSTTVVEISSLAENSEHFENTVAVAVVSVYNNPGKIRRDVEPHMAQLKQSLKEYNTVILGGDWNRQEMRFVDSNYDLYPPDTFSMGMKSSIFDFFV